MSDTYKMVLCPKDSIDYIYACSECYSIVDADDNFCHCCAADIQVEHYGRPEVEFEGNDLASKNSKPPKTHTKSAKATPINQQSEVE